MQFKSANKVDVPSISICLEEDYNMTKLDGMIRHKGVPKEVKVMLTSKSIATLMGLKKVSRDLIDKLCKYQYLGMFQQAVHMQAIGKSMAVM